MTMATRPAKEYLFSLHGTPVRYATASPVLASPVTRLLNHFQRASLEASSPLRVCFQAVQERADIPMMISSSARRLFSGTGVAVGDRRQTMWRCEVVQEGRRLIADFYDQGLFVIDEDHGTAQGYLIEPEAMHPDTIEWFFHIILTELLRRRGLYTIHATALEKDGRGILIPGNSGHGKTTAFMSLLRSGYRYLSDDHPLFRDSGTHVEMLPFPSKIDVTENTISYFPELRNAPDGVLCPSLRKRFFYAEDLYQTSVGDCCEPAMILFPHVIDAPHSYLEPLSRSRALEALLPQSLVVYDPEVARREFQTLVKLVQQVDCYRLHFGQDILELPRLVTPLLKKRR